MDTSYTDMGNGVIRRNSDGSFIPAQDGNRDYAIYRAWVAAGNTPKTPPPPPPPVTIPVYTFLERFTPTEQAAVQTACLANVTLLVGMTTGLASGQIDLTDQIVKTWMAGLVAAKAITPARATVILTP